MSQSGRDRRIPFRWEEVVEADLAVWHILYFLTFYTASRQMALTTKKRKRIGLVRQKEFARQLKRRVKRNLHNPIRASGRSSPELNQPADYCKSLERGCRHVYRMVVFRLHYGYPYPFPHAFRYGDVRGERVRASEQ